MDGNITAQGLETSHKEKKRKKTTDQYVVSFLPNISFTRDMIEIVLLIVILAATYFLFTSFRKNVKPSSTSYKAPSTFNPILDNFKTLEEAQKALRAAGS